MGAGGNPSKLGGMGHSKSRSELLAERVSIGSGTITRLDRTFVSDWCSMKEKLGLTKDYEGMGLSGMATLGLRWDRRAGKTP